MAGDFTAAELTAAIDRYDKALVELDGKARELTGSAYDSETFEQCVELAKEITRTKHMRVKLVQMLLEVQKKERRKQA